MLQIYQHLPQAAYRAQKKIKVYKGNHKHGMYQNHRTVGAFYGELCKKKASLRVSSDRKENCGGVIVVTFLLCVRYLVGAGKWSMSRVLLQNLLFDLLLSLWLLLSVLRLSIIGLPLLFAKVILFDDSAVSVYTNPHFASGKRDLLSSPDHASCYSIWSKTNVVTISL